MAGEFDLLNFLGVQPTDPNNPFATPAPSTSEIIARLAANLTPLAPFIGGTRTPLGRTLGAGAVLGGGVGQTVADVLAQQRLDPLKRQMAIAQHIAQAGTQPTPGAPSMNLAPFAGPATSIPEGSTFELAGPGAFPAVPGPAGPPRFDPANLPIELQLAGGKIFPALDPVKQEEMARVREQANRARFITGAPGASILDISGEKPTVAYEVPDTAQSLATNLQNRIALNLATDTEGNVDYEKAAEVLQRLRTNPQGAEGRIFDYIADRERTGKVDPGMERAISSYQSTIRGLSGARSGGMEGGRLDVRSTERYQQTEEDIARRRSEGTTAGKPLEGQTAKDISGLETILGTTIKSIRDNYTSDFLGPIKGTETAFETRRRAGSYIGSPVEKQETEFRLALKDAGDQLLRARSGAQINEREYDRLVGILPKATDEPKVFVAALDRFEKESRNILEAKRRTATTPRGRAGSLPSPPPTQRPAVDPEVQKYLDSLQRRR